MANECGKAVEFEFVGQHELLGTLLNRLFANEVGVGAVGVRG